MRPSHPEVCPRCGKPTWNWSYLSVRIWIECEHCGFKDSVSNTPVSGANTDSTTRKSSLTPAHVPSQGKAQGTLK
jgi:ribosomal protein L37AE/L43A